MFRQLLLKFDFFSLQRHVQFNVVFSTQARSRMSDLLIVYCSSSLLHRRFVVLSIHWCHRPIAVVVYLLIPSFFHTRNNKIQGDPKNWHTLFLYALTPSDIDRFSNLFHCENEENICNINNNIITKDSTTPQMVSTLLCEISVLKATIENKTTS